MKGPVAQIQKNSQAVRMKKREEKEKPTREKKTKTSDPESNARISKQFVNRVTSAGDRYRHC